MRKARARKSTSAEDGPQSFVMVPRGLLTLVESDQIKAGDLSVYLHMLLKVRPVDRAVIADEKTGEVVAEIPLGPFELFWSRADVGKLFCGGMRGADYEWLGRKCIERLEAAGLVAVRKTAQRARRGFSRDVLALPKAAIHLGGRAGLGASEPGSRSGDSETAETVCSPSHGSSASPSPSESTASDHVQSALHGVSAVRTDQELRNSGSRSGRNASLEHASHGLIETNGYGNGGCSRPRDETPGDRSGRAGLLARAWALPVDARYRILGLPVAEQPAALDLAEANPAEWTLPEVEHPPLRSDQATPGPVARANAEKIRRLIENHEWQVEAWRAEPVEDDPGRDAA